MPISNSRALGEAPSRITQFYVHHDAVNGKYHLSSNVQDTVEELRRPAYLRQYFDTRQDLAASLNAFAQMPSPRQIWEETGAPPMTRSGLYAFMKARAETQDNDERGWADFVRPIGEQWLETHRKLRASLDRITMVDDDDWSIWKAHEVMVSFDSLLTSLQDDVQTLHETFLEGWEAVAGETHAICTPISPWKYAKDKRRVPHHLRQVACKLVYIRRTIQERESRIEFAQLKRSNLELDAQTVPEQREEVMSWETQCERVAREEIKKRAPGIQMTKDRLEQVAKYYGLEATTFHTNPLRWAQFTKRWVDTRSDARTDFKEHIHRIVHQGWSAAEMPSDQERDTESAASASGQRVEVLHAEGSDVESAVVVGCKSDDKGPAEYAPASVVTPNAGPEVKSTLFLSAQIQGLQRGPEWRSSDDISTAPEIRKIHAEVESSWAKICADAQAERDRVNEFISQENRQRVERLTKEDETKSFSRAGVNSRPKRRGRARRPKSSAVLPEDKTQCLTDEAEREDGGPASRCPSLPHEQASESNQSARGEDWNKSVGHDPKEEAVLEQLTAQEFTEQSSTVSEPSDQDFADDVSKDLDRLRTLEEEEALIAELSEMLPCLEEDVVR